MSRLVLLLFASAVLAACSSAPVTVHAPTVVGWERAAGMIRDGSVVELEGRRDGTIRLHLVDGRHLVTTEPAVGEARRLLDACGDPCAAVEVRGLGD